MTESAWGRARPPRARDDDLIDLGDSYARCAWARHFNVSEKQLESLARQAGPRAGNVRERLARERGQERRAARHEPSERPSRS